MVSLRRFAGARNRALAALAPPGHRSFPGRGPDRCRLRRRCPLSGPLENIFAGRPPGCRSPAARRCRLTTGRPPAARTAIQAHGRTALMTS